MDIRDKEKKQKIRLGGTVVARREGSIFEQFLVVGLPGEANTEKNAEISFPQ